MQKALLGRRRVPAYALDPSVAALEKNRARLVESPKVAPVFVRRTVRAKDSVH